VDEMKAEHTQRKKNITAERELREKRLENWKEEVSTGLLELTEFHNFISTLELSRHAKKSSQELSTAISLISTALTNLNKYVRESKHEKAE